MLSRPCRSASVRRMKPEDLDAYLHAHIPLSRHMGLRVLHLDDHGIRVGLPLAPNVNPHGSVFGGSLAALGLVSAWALLHARFEQAGLSVRLVGKQGQCDFLAPAEGDCVAETRAEDFDTLFASFRRLGRARQALLTTIRVGGLEVARHRGLYTALTPPSATESE